VSEARFGENRPPRGRQAIYFEDLASLSGCLRAVCADPEVRLARVCNRLRADYDAAATAGYRDVLVNLSLATAGAARLRLDAAVCELQLVLVDFARIKVCLHASARRTSKSAIPLLHSIIIFTH
jgi:hypothetical protein